MQNTTISDVTPVLGADVQAGDRILTEHHTWSSPITHFVALPADYWGTRTYGWDRVAYAGTTALRPLTPDEIVAILIRPASSGA